MITDNQWWKHVGTKILLVLLLLLAAESSALLYVHRLQRRLDTIVMPPSPSLQVGETIPPVRVLGLDGQPTPFAPEGKLLFVFTQKCHVCVENFPNWMALEKSVGPGHVLYVSTDPMDATRAYAKEKGIESRTVVLADPSEASRLKIFRVPQNHRGPGDESELDRH